MDTLSRSYAAGRGGRQRGTGECGRHRGLRRPRDRRDGANATAEFEDFRFNHALQAVRERVSLLRRYQEATTPDADTFERGLATAAKLLAPVAPHAAEEMWAELGHDDLIAEAEWPAADAPADYEMERRLVENTREDIRDIVETVGIEDPQTITLAIAPGWKHRVLDLARNADGNVVGTVMQDEDLRERARRPRTSPRNWPAAHNRSTSNSRPSANRQRSNGPRGSSNGSSALTWSCRDPRRRTPTSSANPVPADRPSISKNSSQSSDFRLSRPTRR